MAIIRAFIAANLSGSTTPWIRSVQSELIYLAGSLSIKATPLDKLHLTLVFLGELDTRFIPKVIAAMENDSPAQPIEVHLDQIGYFSRDGLVSVAWVGIEKNQKLNNYHAALVKQISKFMKVESASFKPHFTLVRTRTGIDPGVNRKLISFLETKRPELPITGRLNELGLFRSDLKPVGPTYSKLHIIQLQDGIQ